MASHNSLRLIVRFRCALIAHVVFLNIMSVPAQPAPEPVRGQMANGLRYYIWPVKGSTADIQLALVVKAGSFQEEKGQLGAAHFVEHMAFRSTRNFQGDSLSRFFRSEGLIWGRHFGGTTGGEVTRYWIKVPPDRDRLLRASLRVLREWACDLVFDPKEVKAEREVVVAEGLSNPTKQLWRTVEAFVFPTFPYSLERHADLQRSERAIAPDQLTHFYKEWYRPDRQAIIVVGNVDVERVRSYLHEVFASIPIPGPGRAYDNRNDLVVSLSGKKRVLSLTSSRVEHPQIYVYYKRSHSPVDEQDLTREAVYNLAATRRLERAHQMGRWGDINLQHSIQHHILNGAARVDALVTSFEASRADSIGPLLKRVFRELELIRRFGFSAGEAEQARKQIADKHLSSRENESSLMIRIGRHFTDSTQVLNVERLKKMRLEALQNTTVDRLNAVAREWIGVNNDIDVVIVLPPNVRREMTDNDILQWVLEAREADLSQKDVAWDKPLGEIRWLDRPGVSRNYITSEKFFEEAGVTDIALSNGVRLVFRPFRYQNGFPNRVFMNAATEHRSKGSECDVDVSSVLAIGLGEVSGADLTRYLSERKVSLSLTADAEKVSIAGNSPISGIEELARLMYQLFAAQPGEDAADLKHWQRLKLSKWQRESTQKMDKLIAESFDAGSVTRSTWSPEGITVQDVVALKNCHFASAAGYAFVFTGNFNLDSAKRLVMPYFLSLPGDRESGSASPEPANDDQLKCSHVPLAKSEVKTFYEGEGFRSNVTLVLSGHNLTDLSKRAGLDILDVVLQRRILDQLRRVEGAVYSVASQLRTTPGSPCWRIEVSFWCDPSLVNRMVDSAVSELTWLLEEGLSGEELLQAKALVKERYSTILNSNLYWNQYIVASISRDPSKWGDLLQLPAIADSVTFNQMAEMVKLFVRPDYYHLFVQHPASLNKRGD